MSVNINGTTGVSLVQDGVIVTADMASSVPLGAKNLIINGSMAIAQRGTSVSSLTGTAYSTVDRWQAVRANLGTWTESQSTDAPNGFANSLKFECTTADASPAAGDACLVNHRFEGNMFPSLAFGTVSAKTVTLSFYVKSNKTGTFAVGFRNIDNGRSIGGNYTISSADTWEQKTFTFEGDTVSGFNIDNTVAATVELFLGAGTDYTSGTMPTSWAATSTANRAAGQNVNIGDTIGNTFYITGVQLELGSTATAFEHRSYGQELSLCQRYFQMLGGDTTFSASHAWATGAVFNTTDCWMSYQLPTTMRASPTITNDISSGVVQMISDGTKTVSALNSFSFNAKGGRFKAVITGGVSGYSGVLQAVDSDGNYIKFAAEL